ncbi:MAG: hypothetical protein WC201_04945 [Bacilli bacterium]|nr:hypothetical protein [Bacteroidota bacterium]
MEINRKDLSFLGREFLTWLWYKSEERNGAVMIPGEGDVELVFLRRIVLVSGEGEYSETVSCSGLHADLSEGKAALKAGKKVREARIKMGIGNDDWEFTFKADDFCFQSMKLPSGFEEGEDEAEEEGRVLDRIGCIDTVTTALEQLFSSFLELHRSDAWKSRELPQMAKWIGE